MDRAESVGIGEYLVPFCILAALILVYVFRESRWGRLARKWIVAFIFSLVPAVILFGYGAVIEYLFAKVGGRAIPIWAGVGFILAIMMQVGSFLLSWRTNYRKIAWHLFFVSIATMLFLLSYVGLQQFDFTKKSENENKSSAALKSDELTKNTPTELPQSAEMKPTYVIASVASLIGFVGSLMVQGIIGLVRSYHARHDDHELPARDLD